MKFKSTDKNKRRMVITNIIRTILIFCFIQQLVITQYMNCFTAAFCFILTFIPSILQHKLRVYLPINMQIIMIVFVFCAMYLGEIKGFYDKIPYWDKLLHTSSGVILGVIGFVVTYSLNKKDVGLNLSPFFVSLFSFMFAVACGALWEIYEFSMDQIFGFNMQRTIETGIIDTMGDIIVDTIGALVMALYGYFYIKHEDKMRVSKSKE